MTQRLVQLTTGYDRPGDGISDYGAVLAAHLSAAHGVESIFAVPQDRVSVAGGGSHHLHIFDPASMDSVLAVLPETGGAVMAHVSLYGYQKRGVPFALVEALERWAARPGNRLLAVFHELWAFGPPWRSSFWTRPLQRALIRRLARAAHGRLTTTPVYAALLQKLAPRPPEHASILPVFSGAGEPPVVLPPSARARRLAVFGGPGMGRLYTAHADELTRIIKAFGIATIADIGARHAAPPAHLGGAKVETHGFLPVAQVSAVLADSLIGLAPYAVLPLLGKSTVFAAYAAHGVAPLLTGRLQGRAVRENAPAYLTAQSEPDTGLARIQAHNLDWYRGHDAAAHAACIAAMLARTQ